MTSSHKEGKLILCFLLCILIVSREKQVSAKSIHNYPEFFGSKE
jgi:hypothetical protein